MTANKPWSLPTGRVLFLALTVGAVALHLLYTSLLPSCSESSALNQQNISFFHSSPKYIPPTLQKWDKPKQPHLSIGETSRKSLPALAFQTQKIIGETLVVEKNTEKLILFWTTNYRLEWLPAKFSRDHIFYRLDSGNFTCPKKCRFTSDRSLVNRSDAVVFNLYDVSHVLKKHYYPSWRNENQTWVAYALEAPLYAKFAWHEDYHGLESRFNMSLSYRLDSDVYFPYGHIDPLTNPVGIEEIRLPTVSELKSKKLAVALISNCYTLNGRIKRIREIRRYIPVDVFGNCSDPASKPARKNVTRQYKFFLAFENSLCEDYVTEKFFLSLQLGIVPVVYGYGNYDHVAPPHSYVNVLDFATVKHLTDYLKYLDANDDKYLEYFSWKTKYRVRPEEETLLSNFCSLCEKLWESPWRRQWYPDFISWWFHKRPNDPASFALGSVRSRPMIEGCVKPEKLKKERLKSVEQPVRVANVSNSSVNISFNHPQ